MAGVQVSVMEQAGSAAYPSGRTSPEPVSLLPAPLLPEFLHFTDNVG